MAMDREARVCMYVSHDKRTLIEERAKVRGLSINQWLSHAVDQFLDNSGVKPDPIVDRSVDQDVQRLTAELAARDQVIESQKSEIGWLRGENSKLTDRLIPVMIPERAAGFWDRLFGR